MGSNATCTLYFCSVEVKKNHMGRECSTQWVDEKCIHNLSKSVTGRDLFGVSGRTEKLMLQKKGHSVDSAGLGGDSCKHDD